MADNYFLLLKEIIEGFNNYCFTTISRKTVLRKCGECEKRTRQYRKVLWVMAVLRLLDPRWKLQLFKSDGEKQAQTRAFMLSDSFLLKHRQLQSSNAKQLLPVILIDIVAYDIP